MLLAKLIRHNLKHDPAWVIINETVAIGTVYEIIGYESKMLLSNPDTGKWYETPAYYLIGNGGQGYLPCELFEAYLDAN
jgi:hypothetical protein